MSPGAFEALSSLVFGFACAGLLASAFEYLTQRRASFHLLERGNALSVACVPLVVLSAPYIILRNTIRGRRFERRPIPFVMVATMIACVWSMLSGRVLLNFVWIAGN